MDPASFSTDPHSLARQVDLAVSRIRQDWDHIPRVGIILGTGAGAVADAIEPELELPYGDIPEFPTSTALGHVGQFVIGKLNATRVIAMQGRFHLYEGYADDQATLPIRVMRQLGVEALVISNASGGINPQYTSGQIMLIDSHLNLMFRRSTLASGTPFERLGSRGSPYDAELIELATRAAWQRGFPIQRGVYVAMLGPNYETRAEYRMLRRFGGDVVGMSTVPEAIVAQELGIRVLGMSIVTNVAQPDGLQPTSGQAVIDAASLAAPRLRDVVLDVIESLPPGPRWV